MLCIKHREASSALLKRLTVSRSCLEKKNNKTQAENFLAGNLHSEVTQWILVARGTLRKSTFIEVQQGEAASSQVSIGNGKFFEKPMPCSFYILFQWDGSFKKLFRGKLQCHLVVNHFYITFICVIWLLQLGHLLLLLLANKWFWYHSLTVSEFLWRERWGFIGLEVLEIS